MTMVTAGMNVFFQCTAFSSSIFLQSADVILHWNRSQENYLVKDERHHKTDVLVAQ